MKTTESDIFKSRVIPFTPYMERIALHLLGNSDDARDCIQEALMKLWLHRYDLEYTDNLKSYCISTTKNTALDKLKGRKEYVYEIPDSIEYIRDNGKEEIESIDTLIEKLPASQRTALRLRAYNDLNIDEIANKMVISEANVRQLLSRGRKKLRELLRKRANE